MGAWLRSKARPGVAPYTGAWIEIFSGVCTSFDDGSLPTRERGLKYSGSPVGALLSLSLPTRERGLK